MAIFTSIGKLRMGDNKFDKNYKDKLIYFKCTSPIWLLLVKNNKMKEAKLNSE
jgi:hypothetical protein